MKLSVESAIKTAINYLKTIKTQISPDLEDIRLEEVEVSEDDRYWLITLSFTQPNDRTENPLPGIITKPKYQRNYKIFRINSNTGQVESMKIRML
ncbi:MAG: hypothetical protein SAJ12_18050 [Jaaginema sp. PMC 1079.18]|nr:hypothetical protein [Jaaginema sp. PMC 1080.18]MEC4852887.1 hypothetical protein [Jaaginema sp. PMC 1079.18]MEC4868903.1 hypothetical protein [Jaaginema sp. PMC 1078.18]